MNHFKLSHSKASVEERLQSWRNSVQENVRNIKFLRESAEKLESEDIELASEIIKLALFIDPQRPALTNTLRRYEEFIAQYKSDVSRLSSTQNLKILIGKIQQWLLHSLFGRFVLLPWSIVSIYLIFLATPRYESVSQFMVKQADSSIVTTEMALLSGFGLGGGGSDAQLVEKYLLSNDMLQSIDKNLSLKEHFIYGSFDPISRLGNWSDNDDFLSFYRRHVSVDVESDSGIITLATQAFSSEMASNINQEAINNAERFVNKINQDLARSQLGFVNEEHNLTVTQLKAAQQKLIDFQQVYGLLDPETEGAALQSITYSLEGELAQKRTELIAKENILAPEAGEILRLKNEVDSIQQQLQAERDRLSSASGEDLSFGQILSNFNALKVDVELAYQAYAGSLMSIEKAKLDAKRQIKFLTVIQHPIKPMSSSYPAVLYNMLFSLVLLSLFFGIARLVLAVVKELN